MKCIFELAKKIIRQILEHLNLFDIYIELRHFPINFNWEKKLRSVQLVRKCDYIHDQIETVYCFFSCNIPLFTLLSCAYLFLSSAQSVCSIIYLYISFESSELRLDASWRSNVTALYECHLFSFFEFEHAHMLNTQNHTISMNVGWNLLFLIKFCKRRRRNIEGEIYIHKYIYIIVMSIVVGQLCALVKKRAHWF